VDIVLEFGKSFTPSQALPIIDALAPLNPLFVEDPVPIDSTELQADLARKSRVPLGQGERMHSIWEFQDLLSRGGSQYLRACPGLAGGISHGKKIAAVAEAHHSSMVWHNYQGPILTAACIHLDAAIPNCAVQEWYPQSDEGALAVGYTNAMVRDGGEAIVPDAPGLGIDFDPSELVPTDLTGRKFLWEIPERTDGSVAFAV
jgi:galactonate dehydratase